jgi:hypothetical protein
VIDVHTLHTRAGRAVADRPLETLDRLRLAFRERFDAAVREIPHPPVQAFAQRRRFGEESEADALHASTDQVPSGNPQSGLRNPLGKGAYDSMHVVLIMSRRLRG